MISWIVGLAAAGLIGFEKPTTASPQGSPDAVRAEGEQQMQYLFDARLKEERRLDDTAFRLRLANADICPTKVRRLGVSVSTAEAYKGVFRKAAIRRLGLAEGLTVTAVPPDSMAAAAGLRVGDQIIAVNGVPVSGGVKGVNRFLADVGRLLAASGASITLDVNRAGQALSIPVMPVMLCGYDVSLLEGTELNAYADGKQAFVTRAMVRLAAKDEELALVVAHELAHNTHGHIRAKTNNAGMAGMGGLALDVIAAAALGVNTDGAFTKAGMQTGADYASTEFEAEADYVGLYFMARAGYEITGVEMFWRKMAMENPEAIFIRTSHPATSERYVAIAAAGEEIARKRAGNEVLTPNLKPKPERKAR